jgi:HD-GYP domain-containing protein (c-di-GMP phosphodiesterase class II)
MRFDFTVCSGSDIGKTLAIDTGEAVAVGRMQGCELTINDETASRRHCTITAREATCVVTDLQSANGTFVNEERIDNADVKPGDRIRLGSTVIEMVDYGRTNTVVRAGHAVDGSASLRIVETRSRTLVRRAVDPTKLEFLSHDKGKDAAQLLESARNYLTTLHRVSDLLSRAASVEALFDSILAAILDVSGGDRAAILMHNKEAGVVDLVAARTKDGRRPGAVTLSRTVVNDVLDKGISAFTDDALSDERYVGGESIIRQQIRSVMCAPMRTTGEILGVLYVDSRVASEFDDSTLELLAAIGNQAGIAMHRARLIADVERLSVDVMKAIASTIDAKDPYTHKHSERVAALGVKIARHLGFDSETCRVVELSGLLHDVGKIGVSDAILKKPGKLTDAEFSEMREHPMHGARILSHIQSERIASVLPGVKYHHERWDGQGYPEGLKGEEIPMLGRVLGVADFLDAVTSDRSYRKGLPADVAMQMLQQLDGQAFDSAVVKAAVELHDSGELALPDSPHPGLHRSESPQALHK